MKQLLLFLAALLLVVAAADAQGLKSHTPAQSVYVFDAQTAYVHAEMDAICGRLLNNLHVGAYAWVENCPLPG
jgi:hypothetical protein